MAVKSTKILPNGFSNLLAVPDYILVYNNDTYLYIYNYKLDRIQVLDTEKFIKKIHYIREDNFILTTNDNEHIYFSIKDQIFKIIEIFDIISDNIKTNSYNSYKYIIHYKDNTNQIIEFNIKDNEKKVINVGINDLSDVYNFDNNYFLIANNKFIVNSFIEGIDKPFQVFTCNLNLNNIKKYDDNTFYFINDKGIFDLINNYGDYKFTEIYNLTNIWDFEFINGDLIMIYTSKSVLFYNIISKDIIFEKNYDFMINKALYKEKIFYFINNDGELVSDDEIYKSIYEVKKKVNVDQEDFLDLSNEEKTEKVYKKDLKKESVSLSDDINYGIDEIDIEKTDNIKDNISYTSIRKENITKKSNHLLKPNYIPKNQGINCILWNYLGQIILFKEKKVSTVSVSYSDNVNKQSKHIENDSNYQIGSISDEGFILCRKGKMEYIDQYEDKETGNDNLAKIYIYSNEIGDSSTFNLDFNEVIKCVTISNKWFCLLLEDNFLNIYDFGGTILNKIGFSSNICYIFSFEHFLYVVDFDGIENSYYLNIISIYTFKIESKIDLSIVGNIDWIGVGNTGIVSVYNTIGNFYLINSDIIDFAGNYKNLFILNINYDGILSVVPQGYNEKPNPVSKNINNRLVYKLFSYIKDENLRKIKELEFKEKILNNNLKNYFYLKDSNFNYSSSKLEFIKEIHEESVNELGGELEYMKLGLIRKYLMDGLIKKAMYYTFNLKNEKSFEVIYKLFEEAKLKNEVKLLRNLIGNNGVILRNKNRNLFNPSVLVIEKFRSIENDEQPKIKKRELKITDPDPETQYKPKTNQDPPRMSNTLNLMDEISKNFEKDRNKPKNDTNVKVIKSKNFTQTNLKNLFEGLNNSNKSSRVKK